MLSSFLEFGVRMQMFFHSWYIVALEKTNLFLDSDVDSSLKALSCPQACPVLPSSHGWGT